MSNQASDEQGLLGQCAKQYPSMCINIKRDAQNGRVAGDGERYAAMVSDDVGVMSAERRSPRFVVR